MKDENVKKISCKHGIEIFSGVFCEECFEEGYKSGFLSEEEMFMAIENAILNKKQDSIEKMIFLNKLQNRITQEMLHYLNFVMTPEEHKKWRAIEKVRMEFEMEKSPHGENILKMTKYFSSKNFPEDEAPGSPFDSESETLEEQIEKFSKFRQSDEGIKKLIEASKLIDE